MTSSLNNPRARFDAVAIDADERRWLAIEAKARRRATDSWANAWKRDVGERADVAKLLLVTPERVFY